MYLIAGGILEFMTSERIEARGRVPTEDLALMRPEGTLAALPLLPLPPLSDICLLFPL